MNHRINGIIKTKFFVLFKSNKVQTRDSFSMISIVLYTPISNKIINASIFFLQENKYLLFVYFLRYLTIFFKVD